MGTIVVFGLFLRLSGIGFALPKLVHQDESKAVEIAMRIGSGNLNPHWFGYPNGPMMYGLAGVYRAVHTLAEYTFPKSIKPFDETILKRKNWPWFYGIGRVCMALLGALLVLAVSRIGKKFLGSSGAILTAWFTAICAVLVMNSHFITPDIMLTVMLVFAVYYYYLYWECGRRMKYLVFGSIFLGLAMGTKYPGVAGFFFPIIFMLLKWHVNTWKKRFVELVVVMGVSMLVFLITNPYILLSLEAVKNNLITEARVVQAKHDSLGYFGNIWYYISVLWERTSPFLIILYPLGLFAAAWKRKWTILAVLSFGIVYLLGISLHGLHWERWIIPILPFVIIAAAYFFIESIRYINKRLYTRSVIRWSLLVLSIVLIVVMSLQMLWYTNRFVLRFICRGVVTWSHPDYDITLQDALYLRCPDYGKSLH